MFEVIISSVTTGQVRRRTFRTAEQADRYIDGFFTNRRSSWPRSRRNYRVEVFLREALPVGPVPAASFALAATPAA
jgi:hypothetical protein